MKAKPLLDALTQRLQTQSQSELAAALGVTVQTLINWKRTNSELKPSSIANAIVKSRDAAIEASQYETIRPLAEFYRIDKVRTARETSWRLFETGDEAKTYAIGLKNALESAHGIYIFYDSRGRALYVGKAKDQNLWKEMNLAFNRKREVQKISLVKHPKQNRNFKPGHEKLRQPHLIQLELTDLAGFFSAYQVIAGMIDDLEALLVRGFANDLLNVRMETFMHSRT